MGLNRIATEFEKRGIKVATFAREIGISQQTLYNVVKKNSVENITISVFIKIAEGLGMSAEELYYGKAQASPEYSDERQSNLNHHYESLNDQSKTNLVDFVKSYASDPERRIEKDGAEDADDQAAVGA